MDSKKLLNWYSGKEERELYVKTAILNIIIMLGSMLIAAIIWNISNVEQYSILKFAISDLGSFYRNPGYIMFSIGLIIAGIIFIPHALYFYRCLKPDIELLSKISLLFFLISSVGITLVGVFPHDIYYLAHTIAAVMAFGGLVIATLFMTFPLLKKLLRKAEWPSLKILILFLTPPVVIFISTAILIGLPFINDLSNNIFSLDSLPDLWPLFEWLMMLSALYAVFGILLTSKPELGY